MLYTLFSDVPNPKPNGPSAVGRHTWYPYYAGYSPIFVQQVLERANLSPTSVVCDPWNGAGTTTQVAYDLGYPAVGFDLNPVMVIVARSRLVAPSQISALRDHLGRILRRVYSCKPNMFSQNDPLSLWMQPCSILAVRQLECAIWEEFYDEVENFQKQSQSWNISKEAALFYTAVFRCLFRLSKRFRTSNPTWLKVPRNTEDRLCFVAADFVRIFEAEVSQMLSSLEGESILASNINHTSTVKIEVTSSDDLPVNNQEIDIVITSPPYCTRIDYAVSTGLELAFLGFDYNTSVRRLRDRMIGTSTVRNILPEENPRWGLTCNNFLNQIRNHFSKASRSYYLKIHLQYFHDIFRSLLEIDRVLRRGSNCIFVVQDSYYKDIHNDLASIVIEMASSIQWQVIERQNFPVRLTMARVNRHAQRYRRASEAVESVLWFKIPNS